jgi:hypothetical protein
MELAKFIYLKRAYFQNPDQTRRKSGLEKNPDAKKKPYSSLRKSGLDF